MKLFYIVLSLIFASEAFAGGWRTQLEINGSIESIHFANERLGAVAGYELSADKKSSRAVIYRTSDAGVTWQKVFVGGFTGLHSIRFSDEMHAWAVGVRYDSASNASRPYLLYSEDAGISWTENSASQITEKNGWYSLAAVNHETLYLSNGRNHLVKSTDAGQTWNTVLFDSSFDGMGNIKFADSETGWVIVSPEMHAGYQVILHTRDGGKTWRRDSLDYSVPGLQPDFFLDPLRGWDIIPRSTQGFQVYRTSDGGLSWENVFTDPRDSEYGSRLMQFTSPQNGWIAGDTFTESFVYRTKDGGATWLLDREAMKQCLNQFDMWFPSDTSGWIVGTRGTWKGVIIHYSESYSAPVSAEEQPRSDGILQVLSSENSVLLRSDADGIFSLKIYDIMGNLRSSDEGLALSPGQLVPLGISGFTDGVYFVSLRSGEKIIRDKFTIVR